ncbi:MAG: class II fumarate hydratase [Bacteroidales bacterium]|nr:class II fumarate hydratase [Bacteroidales bacterium]MDD4208816.1 class II fumarate hydratase [Bacteroidales bacterium]
MRTEIDSMGEVEVQSDKLWGAQTQRSLMNFKIGDIRMPKEIIQMLAIVKKSAAYANCELGVLSEEKRNMIARVCDEIIKGNLMEHFPLVVWQTGSGTQTNMNINEVISNRAELLLKGSLNGTSRYISPNDEVNKSQSTNDVFPTAMRLAAYTLLTEKCIPALEKMEASLIVKTTEFKDIVKIGRTHLMDATPLRLGSEFSAYASQLSFGIRALKNTLYHLQQLPIGGTAVGTGLNTPKGYDTLCVNYINTFTQKTFIAAENKYEAMASHDAFVETSGALKQLAVSLTKIANDIRFLASGPRCGLGEINLPPNEPGSSIMPGKVNPTQCEAMCMVCAQIIGDDHAITIAGMQGQLQLNVFMPLIAYNILMSIHLLTDMCNSFTKNCIEGITPNLHSIEKHLQNSLMLATALNPHIGYHNTAKIVQYADANRVTLENAAITLGLVTKEQFREWVKPEQMM